MNLKKKKGCKESDFDGLAYPTLPLYHYRCRKRKRKEGNKFRPGLTSRDKVIIMFCIMIPVPAAALGCGSNYCPAPGMATDSI